MFIFFLKAVHKSKYPVTKPTTTYSRGIVVLLTTFIALQQTHKYLLQLQKLLEFRKILFFRKKLLRKYTLQKKKKYRIWGFFNKFLITFLEFFFKRRILFLLKKKKKLKNFTFFLSFFKKIKKPYGLHIRKIELLYIVYYTLLLKDCSFFLNYCKGVFESNFIKTHKKIFLLLKRFFKRCSLFFRRLRVRGFFLDLRGKIGLAGNAKKKRLFFRCRRHSLTKKWLRLNTDRNIIRTTTGVLGITAYIFF